MLNLNAVSGVKSIPLSKNTLQSAVGNNSLKESRAFANYEFLTKSIQENTYKAPSILLASGSGSTPTTATYQNNFYSSNILARDGYENLWQSNYLTNEDYSITYYDGTTLFKRLTVKYDTGLVKVKSIELRNGNSRGAYGFSQINFGYNATPGTNESGLYRHSIRTQHDKQLPGKNAIGFFVWRPGEDAEDELGSKLAVTINGSGNLEILNGCKIDGGINIPLDTAQDKLDEQNNLAVANKGVMYFNKSKNKYRYSENGKPFKYFGSGGGGGGSSVESCNLRTTARYRPLESKEALAVRMYTSEEISIKGVRVLFGSMNNVDCRLGVAIYSAYPAAGNESVNYVLLNSHNFHTDGTKLPRMTSFQFEDTVNINANSNYIVVLYNYQEVNYPMLPFYTSINQASALYIAEQQNPQSYDGTTNQFTITNYTPVLEHGFSETLLNTNVVPYFEMILE